MKRKVIYDFYYQEKQGARKVFDVLQNTFGTKTAGVHENELTKAKIEGVIKSNSGAAGYPAQEAEKMAGSLIFEQNGLYFSFILYSQLQEIQQDFNDYRNRKIQNILQQPDSIFAL